MTEEEKELKTDILDVEQLNEDLNQLTSTWEFQVEVDELKTYILDMEQLNEDLKQLTPTWEFQH